MNRRPIPLKDVKAGDFAVSGTKEFLVDDFSGRLFAGGLLIGCIVDFGFHFEREEPGEKGGAWCDGWLCKCDPAYVMEYHNPREDESCVLCGCLRPPLPDQASQPSDVPKANEPEEGALPDPYYCEVFEAGATRNCLELGINQCLKCADRASRPPKEAVKPDDPVAIPESGKARVWEGEAYLDDDNGDPIVSVQKGPTWVAEGQPVRVLNLAAMDNYRELVDSIVVYMNGEGDKPNDWRAEGYFTKGDLRRIRDAVLACEEMGKDA